MRIIIENKIPFISELIDPAFEAIYLSASDITSESICQHHAEALVVRTTVRCNADLLEGTPVRFIASATIGFDHIDCDYCRSAGIEWVNAPGCNAGSVVQYVLSSLALLNRAGRFDWAADTVGIVGYGNVGSRLERLLSRLKVQTLVCDPFREDLSGRVELHELVDQSRVVSLHTPLTDEGTHPTRGMVNVDLLRRGDRPIWINAARGGIVDEAALLCSKRAHLIDGYVWDCWIGEPQINRAVLADAFIATPHIAGYSADGKANATRMVLTSLYQFFGCTAEIPSPLLPTPTVATCVDLDGYSGYDALNRYLLHTYDPHADAVRFSGSPEQFSRHRDEYPVRREYGAFDPNTPFGIERFGFPI